MGSVGQRDTLVWCGGRQQISEVSTVLRVVGSTVLRVVGSTVLRVVGSTVLRVVGSRDVLDDILDQAHIDAWLGWAGLCLAEPGHGWAGLRLAEPGHSWAGLCLAEPGHGWAGLRLAEPGHGWAGLRLAEPGHGWAGLSLAEPGHGWHCGRPVVEVFVLGSSLGVVKLSTGVVELLRGWFLD